MLYVWGGGVCIHRYRDSTVLWPYKYRIRHYVTLIAEYHKICCELCNGEHKLTSPKDLSCFTLRKAGPY